jgi:hypothetical protein
MKTTKLTVRGQYGQVYTQEWKAYGIQRSSAASGKMVYYSEAGEVVKTPDSIKIIFSTRKLISLLEKSNNSMYEWEKLDTSDFDRHGRGFSYSWDVYDYATVNRIQYVCIQCRFWEKQTKGGYTNTQKSYFIIGKTPTGMFCEEVSGVVVHGSIKKGINVVEKYFSTVEGAE